MQPKLAISFQQRGLPGLLCISVGLGLGFLCRHASPWPETVKHWAFPLAQLLAVGGAPLMSSYVHQRPWAALRPELRGLAALAVGLLGWQLCSRLMAL